MKNTIDKTKTDQGVGAPTPYQKAELKYLARGVLLASPTNPRKSFPELALKELAESIAQLGIKQPLLVRPLARYELVAPDLVTKAWRIFQDGKERSQAANESAGRSTLAALTKGRDGKEFEIVCGERRFRASGLAKLETVPCMVERLSDQDTRKIQLIENLQREDLNPIEEAQGYKDLMEQHQWTVADIQKHLNKSRSHVFAKLSLLKVSPAVREAMEKGQISASVGELIGRIPGEKLQAAALKKLDANTHYLYNGANWQDDNGEEDDEETKDQISYRKAKAILEDDFTVWLKDASFDTEKTYPGAPNPGPCTDCPRRSANCPDEFPGIQCKDVCTNPNCFKAKTELHRKGLLADFIGKGLKILTDKESQSLFRYGYNDGNGSYRKESSDEVKVWKKKLGDAMPAVMGPLDGKGNPVRLIKIAEVKAAAEKAGVQLKLDEGHRSRLETPEEKAKRETEEKKTGEIYARAWAEVAKIIGAGKKIVETLRWLASGQNLKVKPKAEVAEIVAAMAERACAKPYWRDEGQANEYAEELAEALGVDVKKIKKSVEDDFNTAAELGLKKTIRTEGYKFNASGVCTNPEVITIPMPKGCAAQIKLAKIGEDWCAGYDYKFAVKSQSGPCSKTKLALALNPAGAMREELASTRSFFRNNKAALKALDVFDKGFEAEYGLEAEPETKTAKKK